MYPLSKPEVISGEIEENHMKNFQIAVTNQHQNHSASTAWLPAIQPASTQRMHGFFCELLLKQGGAKNYFRRILALRLLEMIQQWE